MSEPGASGMSKPELIARCTMSGVGLCALCFGLFLVSPALALIGGGMVMLIVGLWSRA